MLVNLNHLVKSTSGLGQLASVYLNLKNYNFVTKPLASVTKKILKQR